MLTSQPEFFGPLESMLPQCLQALRHHFSWPGQWGMDDGHRWGPQKSWASYNVGVVAETLRSTPRPKQEPRESFHDQLAFLFSHGRDQGGLLF